MEEKSSKQKKYLWQLTVEEYKQIHQELKKEKHYEHGIKGLAKILGVSRAKAYNVKASGILDEAIFQNGKVIVIDVDKALSLFAGKNGK